MSPGVGPNHKRSITPEPKQTRQKVQEFGVPSSVNASSLMVTNWLHVHLHVLIVPGMLIILKVDL